MVDPVKLPVATLQNLAALRNTFSYVEGPQLPKNLEAPVIHSIKWHSYVQSQNHAYSPDGLPHCNSCGWEAWLLSRKTPFPYGLPR